jgi:hypothetical protein
MKDTILQIAARELGSKDFLFADTRLDAVFTDSLDWVSFIQCLREEIGPLTDEQAANAETFRDLAQCYALPN